MHPETEIHEPQPDSDALRDQVAEGFLFTHSRLAEDARESLEQGSFLYALVEVLSERGLISIEELDARKREVARRLANKFNRKGVGIAFQDPEYDKYNFEGEAQIDCAGRIELCRASCCRLPFALSRQDIREGIVHWDLGQPCLIAQEKDGYCSHMDRGSCACTVREHRPVPCRAYDCRNDRRIWLDFEQKMINPAILDPEWPRNLSRETEPAA
jgi:Fe-S-cluster containining protein